MGHGTRVANYFVPTCLRIKDSIIKEYKVTRFKWPPLRWRQKDFLFFMGRVFVILRTSS